MSMKARFLSLSPVYFIFLSAQHWQKDIYIDIDSIETETETETTLKHYVLSMYWNIDNSIIIMLVLTGSWLAGWTTLHQTEAIL